MNDLIKDFVNNEDVKKAICDFHKTLKGNDTYWSRLDLEMLEEHGFKYLFVHWPKYKSLVETFKNIMKDRPEILDALEKAEEYIKRRPFEKYIKEYLNVQYLVGKIDENNLKELIEQLDKVSLEEIATMAIRLRQLGSKGYE